MPASTSRFQLFPWIVLAAGMATLASPTSSSILADEIKFGQQIRPLLSDKCFVCHGPDAENREGDLRLDTEEAAKDSAIVPGEPSESEVYRRISTNDPDDRMPPPDSKLKLTDSEVKLIRQWIKEGARWDQHWSFAPLRRPAVPPATSPGLRDDIDRFVAAHLKTKELHLSPEASRATLIRRVTFDLTGLPPTLDEIDAFLADKSADAYEKVVDRLLMSDRYGERMAADWLDAARYSDTYGYQVDRDRFVWPWRDWVIRAFNENMPYSDFLTQQLAGDLLPNATPEQILATTFNRLHPQKVEGGSTEEEFRVEYVADRTQTFATAVLGLTLECARCHDHKYDPITQKEYYQFFAFFNSIDESGLYSYFTSSVPTPTLFLTDDATRSKIARIAQRISVEEDRLDAIAKQRDNEFQKWLESSPELKVAGRIGHLSFEDHKDGANRSVAGRVGKAVQMSGDDGIGLKVGNFNRNQPFSVALWMNTPDEKSRAVVFHRSRAWTDAGSRGYQLLIEEGRLSASLIHFWPGNALRVRTKEKIPTKNWLHVTISYDGSSRADGLNIFIDGKPAPVETVRDNLYKNITGGGGNNITIGERFRDRGFAGGLVDEFQVFQRELTPLEIANLHDGQSLQKARPNDLGQLSSQQRRALFRYYLSVVDVDYKAQLAQLHKVRQERSQTIDGLREIMVMRELAKPRPTFVLKRGAYDAPTDEVRADTPVAFPPFPSDQPRNRLGLARWLTSPDHPLTARVAANRLWQMSFGHGLIRTPEDFGSQGQRPDIPGLLDWLADDFARHDWDVKRILKKIVMSATYRQSSQVSKELFARDPDNRWLARGPRYRLSAEMIRDAALANSGLLIRRIGGTPARPYEVESSFKPVKRDKGEGLYRRSVYTYWKRTGPAPMMMTLDASKRNVCRVRRERTSSPLQAFVLLNSPQFVEAARVLAQRLLNEHPEDDDAILTKLFRILTGRAPDPAEQKIVHDLYQDQLAYFRAHPERTTKFLKNGDMPIDKNLNASRLAAVTGTANTLMSFDESVMKR